MTITDWYRDRYRKTYPDPMAMNLRLTENLATDLRELAEQTGRSQQDLAREALEEYVRDYPLRAYPKEVRHLITPAKRSLTDPGALDDLRAAWEGIDGDAVMARLLQDREEDWR
ncbi:MAG: ribbon-helix-helix protein, CopG family [Candidatus Nanopelagicales bacterium]